jgi:hypothetical protein
MFERSELFEAPAELIEPQARKENSGTECEVGMERSGMSRSKRGAD